MKKKLFISLLSTMLLLAGCTFDSKQPPKEVNQTNVIIEEDTKIEVTTVVEEEKSEMISLSDDFSKLEYNGEPFIYINDNVPFFTQEEVVNESYDYYSPLDELGRTNYAMACCGTDLFPDKERGDISMVYPSGWKQGNYEFIDNEGWLYNRCHLIAYCLTGIDGSDETDIPLLERNLFTGTRYLNVYGMWAVEETVYYYLKDNPENHVMYRVTPIYDGNNLLASGVLMEAYSVEDEGKGCQFCVYCFNVQPGVEIDYSTGDNKESK